MQAEYYLEGGAVAGGALAGGAVAGGALAGGALPGAGETFASDNHLLRELGNYNIIIII